MPWAPTKPSSRSAEDFSCSSCLPAAINELRKFNADPLKKSNVAPIAVVNLSTLLRAQNNFAEAADLLSKARQLHEGPLAQDPTRAAWIHLLRFHNGIALREAGKLPEARALFDQVVKQAPKSPEGVESALRFGQCLKEEGLAKIEAGKKLLQAIKKPQESGPGEAAINEGLKSIRDASTFFETSAEQLKSLEGQQDLRARMLYEAAWGLRIVAEPEVKAARLVVAREMVKKMGPGAEKLPLPEPTFAMVPVQPSEAKARTLYQSLIAQFGDTPLSLEARYELAELFAQRNENDPAAALLTEAMDKEPSADLTERIRLRLGSIHAAKGNVKGALAQFDAVALNPKSPHLGWAYYGAAEIHLKSENYGEAIKRLTIFRDNGQYHNIPGLSDRALLRLGHAYAMVKGWGESQQAMERVVNQHGSSPWVDEARYGIAWAQQRQNNWDGAVNWYTQIVGRTATELGAKAQHQIGVCRFAQKRYADAANAFLAVATTYDYKELTAASLLEAAKAYRENDQKDQAVRILERVIREYPNTVFAEAAKELMQ